jgi:hypothetical protein
MDPCLHPELLYHHGQFLSDPKPHRDAIPRFALCKTLMHNEIQIPNLLSWVEDIYPRRDDPEWENKPEERLTWRGSNTGTTWFEQGGRWRQSHRIHLVSWANEVNGSADVLISGENVTISEVMSVTKSKLNPALLDIAFAGEPLQCSPDVCSQLKNMFDWRRVRPVKEVGKFKYIMDVRVRRVSIPAVV